MRTHYDHGKQNFTQVAAQVIRRSYTKRFLSLPALSRTQVNTCTMDVQQAEAHDDEDDEDEDLMSDASGEDEILNDDNDEEDDEPEAECDADVQPRPEPSYENANSVQFFTICERLQSMFDINKSKKKKRKISQEEKLKCLLPPQLVHGIVTKETTSSSDAQSSSIFPLLRLYLPKKDGSRRCNVKEKTLAQMYAKALNLNKGNADYEMLFHYTECVLITVVVLCHHRCCLCCVLCTLFSITMISCLFQKHNCTVVQNTLVVWKTMNLALGTFLEYWNES
jgi:hypothetical protein